MLVRLCPVLSSNEQDRCISVSLSNMVGGHVFGWDSIAEVAHTLVKWEPGDIQYSAGDIIHGYLKHLVDASAHAGSDWTYPVLRTDPCMEELQVFFVSFNKFFQPLLKKGDGVGEQGDSCA